MTAEEIIKTLEDRNWKLNPVMHWRKRKKVLLEWSVSDKNLTSNGTNYSSWRSTGATIAEAVEKALKEHGHE